MDIRKIERSYSRFGRIEYPPRILLKILVYGYMRKIYSSRELERACRENICFMYLLGDYPPPDHNTIARFRSKYLLGNEQELLEQLVEMLRVWGFLSLENVFIDGTKIEANSGALFCPFVKLSASRVPCIKRRCLNSAVFAVLRQRLLN